MREKLRLQWESKQKSIKEEEVKLGACFFLSLYEPSRAKNLSFLNVPFKIFSGVFILASQKISPQLLNFSLFLWIFFGHLSFKRVF